MYDFRNSAYAPRTVYRRLIALWWQNLHRKVPWGGLEKVHCCCCWITLKVTFDFSKHRPSQGVLDQLGQGPSELVPSSKGLQVPAPHPKVFRALLTHLIEVTGGILRPPHHGSPSSQARVMICSEAGEVYAVLSRECGLLGLPQLSSIHSPQPLMAQWLLSHTSH